MLISPAFKMLGWGAVSGSQRLFLCMLQNPNVKVFLSVDFVQESLRFVFQHLLGLAGETWQETQSAHGSASTHKVGKHFNVFSSSELTFTCRGFLYVKVNKELLGGKFPVHFCICLFFFFLMGSALDSL